MKARVVNKRKEPYDVYIGRGSKWGNPFRIGDDGDRADVIKKYEGYLLGRADLLAALPELDGKTLGCFCKPSACHGDVLLDILYTLYPGGARCQPCKVGVGAWCARCKEQSEGEVYERT